MKSNYHQLPVNLITLISTVTGTIIILSPALGLAAKKPQEIAQFAQQVTVQINNNIEGHPGGSGVIIGKKGDNYVVLTANHVVCDSIPGREPMECRTDLQYSVRTPNGQQYTPIQIEHLGKTSKEPDLAIVVFKSPQNYAVASLGNSDSLPIASDVYVAGFPAVLEATGSERNFDFRQGAVTGKGDTNVRGYNLVYNAVTATGVSGGPVFNQDGKVVGIHGLGDASGANKAKTGYNAAIPVNTFQNICTKNPPCAGFNLDSPPPQTTGNNNTTIVATNPISPTIQRRLEHPQRGREHYKKGLALLGNQQYNEAIEAFNQALASNPDEDTTFLSLVNRGYSYSSLENWQAALNDYNQALTINPNSAQVYTERANILSEMGDMNAALSDYNRAIALDPYYIPAYNDRAFVLNRQNDFFHAALDLEKAKSLLESQGGISLYNYIYITENLLTLYRNDRNLRLIRTWGLTIAPCSPQSTSILFGEQEYCTEPVAPLEAGGKYKYNPYKLSIETLNADANVAQATPPANTAPPNTNNDPNLGMLQNWGLTVVPCSSQTVTILINQQKYCANPTDWLTIGTYRYLANEDRLEPVTETPPTRPTVSGANNNPNPTPPSEPVNPTSPPAPVSGEILAITPQFTFNNLWDYGNCLEDILQLYIGPENFKQRGREGNCLPEIFQMYENTGFSHEQALYLIQSIDHYATTALFIRLFPLKGQRVRVRQMFGYVYKIDEGEAEIR